MKVINKDKYIDSETLSQKLDEVIMSESNILKKNIKKSNINIPISYV